MKTLTLVIIALALSACAPNKGAKNPPPPSLLDVPCTEIIPMDDPSKEDILIVGDSISIGYTPTVRTDLPQYEFTHNPCNGMTSVNGLSRVDSWIAMRPHWKLISFNHGLWDIVPFYDVPVTEYKKALREEGLKFKAVADHVIFFTTTFVPFGTENRNDGDVTDYNWAAREVMAELDIPVYDLYTVSTTIPLSEHLSYVDVHYTTFGYSVLGDFVSASINDALSK